MQEFKTALEALRSLPAPEGAKAQEKTTLMELTHEQVRPRTHERTHYETATKREAETTGRTLRRKRQMHGGLSAI
eukprot:3221789-Pleurochrysis_carterae.AAC.1